MLVYYKEKTLQWKIQRMPSDGMYILGEDGLRVTRYKTVKKLIKAHRGVMGRPIKLQGGGVVTLSKSYVSVYHYIGIFSQTYVTVRTLL